MREEKTSDAGSPETPLETAKRLRTLLSTLTHPQAREVVQGRLDALSEKVEGERASAIVSLRSQIVHCRDCGLNRTRTKAVPWSGPGFGKADLMVVGEAPGADEDRKGVPFVGASGRLLDQLLRDAGTDRSKVMVFNTLCCRPPENRDPRPVELKKCRPNFDAQVELADLSTGVTLGVYATASVMGVGRTTVSMHEVAGKPFWRDGRVWVPTFHPAYALRNPGAKIQIQEHLGLALALRFGSALPPIPPFDQVELDGVKGENVIPALEKHGWAYFYSPTLRSQIVVVKREEDYPEILPIAVRHLPWYTYHELVRVGLVGRGRRREWTDAELQRLHMVKWEFGGTVVPG